MKKLFVVVGFLLVAGNTCAQVQNAGFPPFGSFEIGTADAVNRQNLNVNILIPIVSGNARGMSFNATVSNNSLLWWNGAGAWDPVTGPSDVPTWGWNVTSSVDGNIQNSGHVTICHPSGASTHNWGYFFVEADGTTHPFSVDWTVDCSGNKTGTLSGYATDESGYFLDVTTGVSQVYSVGGIRRISPKDTNGNTFTSTVPVGGEVDWTDSAGHTALKVITSTANVKYEYPDPTGAYQTTVVTLQSFNIKTNFGCTGVIEYTGTASLPTLISLPNGQFYAITYEPTPQNTGYVTGRISKITLPDGGYIQYQYGATNDSINCTDGTVTNLTRIINDGTNSYTWQFVRALNGSNWQTTVTAPQMPYDSAPNQSVSTFNTSGQILSEKIYQGSATTGALLRTINTTWATNGTPATVTTILEDNSTQSEVETSYDSNGNLLSTKEHDYGTGTPGSILRTTALTYLTSSAYTTLHIMNRVTKKTVADSTSTIKYREDTSYDGTTLGPCPTGAAQHDDVNYGCSFTTRGNPTSSTTYTDAATPAGGVAKNSYYDMFGNLVQADVDCCQTMNWNFSVTNQYGYPNSVVRGTTSGTHLTTNYTYNSYTGQIASINDPNNQTTSYAYDSIRRQTSLTRPDQAQIVYSYDDTNHTMTVSNPVQATNVVKNTTYEDGLGRAIQTTTFDASGVSYTTTTTQYEGLDRGYKVSNPYTTSAQYWTQTNFDALGRPLKVVLPDNSQITYSYTGPSVTTTDPAGHPRKMQNEGLGRLAIVFEPDPTNGNSLTLQTNYSHTVLDQLGSVTQGSQTRTWSYDGMGRVTGQTLPESGTTSFQYNNYNLISQRADARGVITTYSYDTLNRRYQTIYNVGATGVPATPTVTYLYGTNTTQYNNGKLLTLTDGLGTTTNTYDNLARVTQVQHVINGSTYNIGYQYNLAGEVTSLTYPSNRIVQKSYDAIGRLSSLSSGTTTYANTFSYNPSFFPTNFTYGNGVAGAFGYSPDRLQLQSVNYTGASTVFSTTYSRSQNGGNNGQITAITDSEDSGRSTAYTYDALGRISTAITTGSTNYPKWGLSWTYDRYGNRTNQTVTSGTAPSNSVVVNPANNRITTAGYSYDANGNVTNDAVNALAYDADNRIVSSAGSPGSGTYSYRASGIRAVKVSSGTTTVYLFDGNEDIAEYTNGTLANEYVYLGQRLLATHASGTLYYHVGDHQSSRVILDSSGNIAGQKGHYPFGEDWYTSTLTNRHFTSYERDSESTNDNALHRFLVDRLGRFSATDPAPGGGGTPQGFNLYSYVANDPINHMDPTGRYVPVCPIWGPTIFSEIFCGNCGGTDSFTAGEACSGDGGTGGGEGCENSISSEGNSCPPPEPTPEPPPSTPTCFAQLKFRPITGALRKFGNHTFWYVKQSDDAFGNIVAGARDPQGGNDYLNAWVSSATNPHNPQDLLSSPVWPSSPNDDSANNCGRIQTMMDLANAWQNYHIPYPILPNAPFGPNSNTIARVFGEMSGFRATQPPKAKGWFAALP